MDAFANTYIYILHKRYFDQDFEEEGRHINTPAYTFQVSIQVFKGILVTPVETHNAHFIHVSKTTVDKDSLQIVNCI